MTMMAPSVERQNQILYRGIACERQKLHFSDRQAPGNTQRDATRTPPDAPCTARQKETRCVSHGKWVAVTAARPTR